MRLEPVAERTAQHARGGAGRAALRYIMPAIKEICGIARIKGHGHESRKRRELRARPLPAVSDEVVKAERAGACGMRADGRRIPGVKIKIAVALAGRLVAPGMEALLLALGRTVSSAMELRFGGELAPKPICVSGGFGVTYVHRPLQREADFAEHGAIQPEIAFGAPEHGMRNIVFGAPGPTFGSPERAVLVAAGLYETQEIVVGDVVAIHGELGNSHLVSGELVVPAKFLIARVVNARRGVPCRNFNEAGLHARSFPRDFLRVTNLFAGGQAVQHVGERLRVHQTMFDRDVEHLHQLRMAFFRALESMLDGVIELFADAMVVTLDFLARGPVLRSVGRKGATADRVDSEREKLIEGSMKRA